jgi:hypothetical protein
MSGKVPPIKASAKSKHMLMDSLISSNLSTIGGLSPASIRLCSWTSERTEFEAANRIASLSSRGEISALNTPISTSRLAEASMDRSDPERNGPSTEAEEEEEEEEGEEAEADML